MQLLSKGWMMHYLMLFLTLMAGFSAAMADEPVMVGGKACQKTLGQADKDAWQWVDGGTFDLAAGEIEVRLHDLTGWWGRCDALVLAGPGFQAADDPKALAQQREKYGGVSREIDDRRGYDVVVVGGGLSGCGAAVAAARHGCRVALVQDRPVPFEAPAWAYHWSSPDDFEPASSHRRQSAGRPPNFDLPSRGKGRRPRDNDPNGSVLHCKRTGKKTAPCTA